MPTGALLGVAFPGENNDRVLIKKYCFYNSFHGHCVKKCIWIGWQGGFVLEKCDGFFKETPHMFFLTAQEPVVRKLVKLYMTNPNAFRLEAKSFKEYTDKE